MQISAIRHEASPVDLCRRKEQLPQILSPMGAFQPFIRETYE